MAVFDDMIRKSLVRLDMSEPDGYQVVTSLVERAAEVGLLAPEQVDEAITSILKREQSASTALSDGIAMPHGRTDCVKELVCMIGIHPGGVDFGSLDGQPTRIFIQILAPVTVACGYIQFLANLSRRLQERPVRDALLAATSREHVLDALTGQSNKGLER